MVSDLLNSLQIHLTPQHRLIQTQLNGFLDKSGGVGVLLIQHVTHDVFEGLCGVLGQLLDKLVSLLRGGGGKGLVNGRELRMGDYFVNKYQPGDRCQGQAERNQSKKYAQGAWRRTSYPIMKTNNN